MEVMIATSGGAGSWQVKLRCWAGEVALQGREGLQVFLLLYTESGDSEAAETRTAASESGLERWSWKPRVSYTPLVLTTELRAGWRSDYCYIGLGAILKPHDLWSILAVEMDGRSIAVMVESGNSDRADVEEESIPKDVASECDPPHAQEFPSNSCPTGVRLNASVNLGSTQCETSAAGEVREYVGEEREAGKTQKKTTSFAGLFSGNRMPSKDSKLELFNQDEELAMIELEDIQESDFLWERCLIGYFGGRFPGRQALRKITNSWKVQVTVKHHGSGWLVFQFSSEDDKANVLGNGPYIIYGRPLLLKAMPRLFKFGNEAISTFPIWVQLRYIPLDIWCPRVFGIICSKIGKPIHMDKMTTQKERITYARCLVEIDMAKEIKHTVKVNLNFPGGGIYEQPVFYENLPRYAKNAESCRPTISPTLPS
ncbi:hypothetical protein Acr_29g0000130 [Actinidia rufa]|uniref:DUF4283 domain-containing protein n=1 Tax=Actinidia rufa TaxID=165716 RepID=A0A7J0HCZ2_9ERIC|nr:hypothetical protein Acr_29g0000130 [Actinidia rufa]